MDGGNIFVFTAKLVSVPEPLGLKKIVQLALCNTRLGGRFLCVIIG